MKKKITTIWQKLNFRERIILMVFLLVVMPMIIIRFILIPTINKSSEAYQKYQINKKNILKLSNDINFYKEISLKSSSAEFDFKDVLDRALKNSDITTQPTINQESSEIFGDQYVLSFSRLRSDQILRLIFYLESNTPPVFIDKIEAVESIIDKDFNDVTLVIKTE